MDLHMPGWNGVKATTQLQKEMPDVNILMLTVSEKEEDLVSALNAGAQGYLLKNEEPELLVHAIEYIAQGGMLVSPQMAGKLREELKVEKPRVPEAPLNPRDEQLLALLADDATEKEIAARINTTENAVATQLRNVLHKLRLANGRLAAVYAKLWHKPTDAAQEATGDAPAGVPGTSSSLPDSAGAALDTIIGKIEIVISPQVEANSVLKLLRLLKEGGKAVVTGVRNTGTVLRATVRQPLSLTEALRDMHLDAEVTEVRNSGPSWSNRFRVVLKSGELAQRR